MAYRDILVIDDDLDDAEFFVEAVRALQKNIRCRFNTDPVKALAELKTSKELPDLLFLDINMPCLNGFDVLREIKKDSRLKHIDVILISSPSEEVIRRLVPGNDFEKYMSKPCSYNEFVAELNTIL